MFAGLSGCQKFHLQSASSARCQKFHLQSASFARCQNFHLQSASFARRQKFHLQSASSARRQKFPLRPLFLWPRATRGLTWGGCLCDENRRARWKQPFSLVAVACKCRPRPHGIGYRCLRKKQHPKAAPALLWPFPSPPFTKLRAVPCRGKRSAKQTTFLVHSVACMPSQL